jgi:nucleotide-binding universal stress UspA family protein
MKILLALDGSQSSEVLLQQAIVRPWPAGTTFCLLNVVDPFFFAKAPLLLEEAKQAAYKALKIAAESFEGTGWMANTEVILGNPRRAISDYASAWKADLVMVGSQGLGALTRIFVGSTARAVLRQAPCSVEIVRPPAPEKISSGKRAMNILLATDGSEFSIEALRSIASRPWPEESEVKVISVPEIIVVLGEFPYFRPQEIEDLNKSAVDHARQSTDAGIAILSKTGLKVSAEVPILRETPARSILSEAEKWRADLVVLGSHGRRGFDRLAMGSVSEVVALHAHCSVEVIRGQTAQKQTLQKGEIQ